MPGTMQTCDPLLPMLPLRRPATSRPVVWIFRALGAAVVFMGAAVVVVRLSQRGATALHVQTASSLQAVVQAAGQRPVATHAPHRLWAAPYDGTPSTSAGQQPHPSTPLATSITAVNQWLVPAMAAMAIAAVGRALYQWFGRWATPQQAIAMTSIASMRQTKGVKGPVFSEKCDRVGITLTRFMNEMVRANPDMAELESVFASIQTAGKAISKLVGRAPIDGMLGKHGGGGAINVQGEEQKKLDVIANEVLKKVLKYTGRMGVIASEEEAHPVEIDNTMHPSYDLEPHHHKTARYTTVFDPLDGSSNVDAGIPVGTIFGIFEQDEHYPLPDNFFQNETTLSPVSQDSLRHTLKSGRDLVAAGYVLYSSSTYFVFTLGAGVNGFTLDNSLGEFILTHPNIKIPPRGHIYSINSANSRTWDKPMQVFIDSLADGTNQAGTEYTSRYIGSMVGDVHRTLMYGGVFAYPADNKNPKGKLRLLYEAAPMSFLLEQAAGKCSTGIVPIMDIAPKNVHQRVPCIMGGAAEVEELEMWYAKLGDDATKAAHKALLTPLY